mgnify:CR=1 FL=1
MHASSHSPIASPRHTLPHLATPRHTSPCLATPRHASPRLATPRHASPRLATPRHASPRLAARRLASPRLAARRLAPRLQAQLDLITWAEAHTLLALIARDDVLPRFGARPRPRPHPRPHHPCSLHTRPHHPCPLSFGIEPLFAPRPSPLAPSTLAPYPLPIPTPRGPPHATARRDPLRTGAHAQPSWHALERLSAIAADVGCAEEARYGLLTRPDEMRRALGRREAAAAKLLRLLTWQPGGAASCGIGLPLTLGGGGGGRVDGAAGHAVHGGASRTRQQADAAVEHGHQRVRTVRLKLRARVTEHQLNWDEMCPAPAKVGILIK